MLIRSATILCLFAAVATTVARCATIKQREIPVEVRYEDKTKGENSIRNLDEKIQLSPEEEKQSLKLEETKTTEEPASPNNLDASLPQKGQDQIDNAFQQEPLEEKPKPQQQQQLEEKQPEQQPEKKLEDKEPAQQLEEKPQQLPQQKLEEEPLLPSSEKPAQQEPTAQPDSHPLRHLPVDVDEPKQPKEEKPVEVKKLEDQPQPKPENPPLKEAEPSPPQQQQEEPKPTQQPSAEKPQESPASSKSLPEEPKEPSNLESILQQAQTIVFDGLKQLREGFKPEKGDKSPEPEQWESLEKSINQFFDEEKNKLQTKQDQPPQPQEPQQNQNIFQTIAAGIQSSMTNFVQNLQSQGAPQTQGDEGTSPPSNQNGFQAFVAAFQGGMNNIVSTINNLGNQQSSTSNTVLGDEDGASSPAPGGAAGVFSNIVSNVQQFFGGQGTSQQGAAAVTQGIQNVQNALSPSSEAPAPAAASEKKEEPEQKQPEQPEQKQPEQKQPEQKQPEEKQPEQQPEKKAEAVAQ